MLTGQQRFERRYARVFAALGRPVHQRDATPEPEIAAAERRMNLRVPDPLRGFYRVGGQATDFTCVQDRFLPPKAWRIEAD